MVHALEEIRRLLKPAGVLIEIHPAAVASPIEIHQGGRIEVADYLSVAQWCKDFQQADEALTEIVQRGLFSVEREAEFDSLAYYTSAAELRMAQIESIEKFARDAESISESVPHVEALAARVGELMGTAGGGAELIVREPTHISRLRPI